MEAAARTRAWSCGTCGKTYTRDTWRDLPISETLTPAAITLHVVRWPANQAIEVRRCRGCGGRIARKVTS